MLTSVRGDVGKKSPPRATFFRDLLFCLDQTELPYLSISLGDNNIRIEDTALPFYCESFNLIVDDCDVIFLPILLVYKWESGCCYDPSDPMSKPCGVYHESR